MLNKTLTKQLLGAVLAAGGLVSMNAHANLLINGSFEAPVTYGWNTYSSIPGWTGNLDIEVQNHAAGTPYDGNQLVELDTYGNSSMSQTVVTVLNKAYELSFAYSPRPGVSADSNGIEVWWNGTHLASLTGTGAGDTAWTVYHYTVIGTGGQDEVKFVASGISDSYGGYLDGAQLNAVPEPTTVIAGALLLLPFGVSAVRVMRKKIAA